MICLSRDLRRNLEKIVKEARRAAESGARKALEQLGVGEGDIPKHLSPTQRVLRNRLRAHARQLGDRRDSKSGAQATFRLIQECAYEHWHRMLFSRFLAEADLLIEPKSGIAVTLEEVHELARAKNVDWLDLASEYAERMLPQIFRNTDPVLSITLPRETRSELEDLLKALSPSIFQASDSLGWVYQFWQADRKTEINESGVKIGADELPAVTQLFTEDYMVLFLLQNTLGAWWAGKYLNTHPALANSATSEDELRTACQVGDIEWPYLRFVRNSDVNGARGRWRPAAGVFEGWPNAAKELTLLDPCMGSGHFLISALPILVAFRMAEEGLSRNTAIDAVLRDNLFGLEIDPRCTQIAAFNVAFTAWRMAGYRALPRLNLACSGLAIGVSKSDWLKLAETAAQAGDTPARRDLFGVEKNLFTTGINVRVKTGLATLYDLFAKAPWLGSLIDPHRANGDIFEANFAELEPLMVRILAATDDAEAAEIAVAAQGMSKAAELLGKTYTIIVTNVPYLARGRQDATLALFCEQSYPEAKADLATCFVERWSRDAGGSIAVVTPQNWLFLRPYAKLRRRLLSTKNWNFVIRLGEHGFESPQAAGAFTAMLSCSNSQPKRDHDFCGIDASAGTSPERKQSDLRQRSIALVSQRSQLLNADSIIALSSPSGGVLLGEFAESYAGICTGDYPRFGRQFWEIENPGERWAFQLSTVAKDDAYGGRERILLWDEGNGSLRQFVAERLGERNVGSWIRGKECWGKRGVAVSLMRSLPVSHYTGELFDDNVAVLMPRDEKYLLPIFAYLSSKQFNEEVRRINQKVAIKTQYLVKIPFDYEYWQMVASKTYPDGLPKPIASMPNQWLFGGRPSDTEQPLQVGLARLLGFRWPRQIGISFFDSPAVPPDRIGAHAASDGIVCLAALKGDQPAAERLIALLAGAFGPDWSASRLAGLLADVGFAGKTVDDWLRDGFFAQHCTLFAQRPFIWHIWDGRRDGFHALVNYHRLAASAGEGKRTLERLIYSYLGEWTDRQRADQRAGVEGADGRLVAAEHLRAELTKILEGEPPYDIFARWKPLHEQPIGWEPDLNDGVRINIRPFMTARPFAPRSATACVLRNTPKIKWDKDRGKEPQRAKQEYPWFWNWDTKAKNFAGGQLFDGNRWNSLHYGRKIKENARDGHAEERRGKE